MRKLLHILFCITATLAVPPVTFAATTIPTGSVNGHWTLSGSPYQVTGHIIVPNGDSLIIDPGVVVEFQGKYKLFCNGRILANGTAGSGGILFTISAAAASAGWLGIRYDQTPTTNDTSRFLYCTIEGGKANVAGDESGGAFYFRDFSKCSIGHCTIRNSYAMTGGAIYGDNAAPHIFNDTFINNTCYGDGHDIDFWRTSGAVMERCYFSGGIACVYSSLVIRDCTFQNCSDQGAISSFSDGNSPHSNPEYLLIERNIFIGNRQRTGGGGGAVLLLNTAGKIEHNIFSDNVSEGVGGAISCFTQTAYPNSGTTIISNNLLYKNKAKGTGGGGIYFSNCSGKVINNTIVNNASNGAGGGIYIEAGSSPAFYNNIIYGDTAHGVMEAVFIKDNPSDPDFYNNDLEGGYSAINTNGTPLVGANVGNINLAPLFINPAINDYTLATGSPCIDAGTTTGITVLVPSVDLAGAARIMGTAIDMGAYEVLGTRLGIPKIEDVPLNIYPTPASNYLSIGNLNPGRIAGVQIWSADGRLLASFAGSPDNRYDVRNINAGTLLVRVITKEHQTFTRVVPKY